jgi:hypothetical protein
MKRHLNSISKTAFFLPAPASMNGVVPLTFKEALQCLIFIFVVRKGDPTDVVCGEIWF